MVEAIFWFCLFLPFYAWIGYPLALAACGLFLRPRQPPSTAHAPQPVSVIIAAHNEALHIAQKLHTLLAQDYPAELEIIVASDGSSDDTAARARAIDDRRIKVLDLPRQGKAAALNAAAGEASHAILVFTDADNRWQRDTLAHLVAPFADARVGCCVGNMQIPRAGHALSIGDLLYRHYENWLRAAEDRFGCVVSADGALLALRRELFQPAPAEVNDDFFLCTCAPVAGKRSVYVSRAKVLDSSVDTVGNQFRRRVRITVGGLRSLVARRELMNPLRHGLYAVALVSHKLIRRLAPLLLAPLLLLNLPLWNAGGFYRFTLAAQLAGYAIGLLGLLDRKGRLPKPFRAAGFLLITLAGIVAGLWLFLRGRRYALWNPQQNR